MSNKIFNVPFSYDNVEKMSDMSGVKRSKYVIELSTWHLFFQSWDWDIHSRYINQFKNEPAVASAKTNSSENAHMQLPAQS